MYHGTFPISCVIYSVNDDHLDLIHWPLWSNMPFTIYIKRILFSHRAYTMGP